MKIRLLSDLHREFGPIDISEDGVDVMVLAGDIDVGTRGVKWALESFTCPVIYVLGNHEYYSNATPYLLEKMRRLTQGTNVHILENESVTIRSVRFLGCSLWTDFSLFGAGTMADIMGLARREMNDYRKIRVSPEFRRLKPIDTLRMYQQSVDWLEEELSTDFSGTTVVVTHHAPSIEAISPSLRKEALSAAYATDLSDLEGLEKVDIWVHGHTHYNASYSLGSARVLSNQRGYAPHDLVEGFDENLLIECEEHFENKKSCLSAERSRQP